MAAISYKNSRVLVNDSHVSGNVREWSVQHQRTAGPVTSILDEGDKFTPGLLSGSVSLSGAFDSAAGGLFDEAKTSRDVDNALVVTVLPEGYTHGKLAIFAVTDLDGFEVTSGVGETVSLSISAQADDGVDMGHVLHALQAETAGGNAASVDNLASTAAGGASALHVTAYSGLTNLTVKVQHSTDNTVWADLITFTAATGKTSERRAVTGTVNRYVRTLWTVTGTGSATFAVAFARR